MIHYHGTPITPRAQLMRMVGRHFCISFAHPRDLGVCVQIGQSVMLDNGAFSAFTKGVPFNEDGYYAWLDPVLVHPHWGVVPDVIGGDEKQQCEMVARWPFPREFGAPVWHLGLSIDHLLRLADEWPRICLGSSSEYWQVGSRSWCGRMDEAFNELAKRHNRLPWIHGLRMLSQTNRWPLASADSTNVAQNFKLATGCAECKAAQVDAKQPPLAWVPTPTQRPMLF